MSRRRVEEFYCAEAVGGCGKYFTTYLRENMFGNFTIECPACQHHHFRVIKEGVVSQDRHDKKFGESEIIMGLKATLRATPWHNDPEFRRQQLYPV